jgi:hypothetical protein
MTLLSVKAFNGLKPIVKPRLLGPGDAQVAQNARLISGSLEAMRASTTLKAAATGTPKTIFKYGDASSETNYWLEFTNDTDVMRSPIPNDQWDRLYWTDGIGLPRYAPNSMILSSQPYPGASYQLGLPAPNKPTIGSFSAVPVYTPVTREYVLTFYNPTSTKESAPSSVFTVQAVDGQKTAVSNLTTNNQGDAGITKKRLYRKVSGTYRRVTELDLSVTTYDDTATDASLASAATLSLAVGSAPAAPGRAPTVTTSTVTPTAAGISRSYIYTIKNVAVGMTGGDGGQYTEYFAESAASAVYTVTADTTQTVTISGMSNTLGGSHFRVYRKDAGSSSYQFVAEVPVAQTSVADVIAATTLGGVYSPDGAWNFSPSVAPTGSVNSSTAKSTVSRVYMATYLDASGNESTRSPVSSVISAVDGQTSVTITQSETVPAGVAKKRIYRQTVTVTNGVISVSDANWKLVIEVPATTTSGVEALADVSLGAAYPTALRDLPVAPNATPTLNATIPTAPVPETRTYVITYVSAYGEEGPPSDASDLATIDPTKSVTVDLAGSPTGSYNVTLKRIYRSSTVGNQAQFQFVAEVPLATSSYVDEVDQADLGEVLPSEGWVAPPADLKGLRMLANGAAVGFSGRTVYLSEPNMPHAWPHKYTIDFDIVGIAVFGQTVAVLTNAYPFLLQGADPAAMTPTKLEFPQACVSKRSIVETGDGVLYASPDGYVSIGSGVGLITATLLSRDGWQAYVPSSMECYLYNGRIHVMYNTGSVRGCLVIDPTGQGAVMTTMDINAATAVNAGYYDPARDILYLAQGGNIVRVDQGSALTATWRSRLYRLPWQQNMSVAQVRAASYPVTLRIYADGVLKTTKTVTSAEHFPLAGGFRALDWEFEIDTTTEVSEVNIATSVAELKAV